MLTDSAKGEGGAGGRRRKKKLGVV